MELPVRFVYTENGKEKSSIDENKRMNEIDQLNKDLHKWYIDGWRREEAKKMTISLRRENNHYAYEYI